MAVKRLRLDAELVRRSLARSRVQAQDMIDAGRVLVNGVAATKHATQVETSSPVHVLPAKEGQDYVSRGAHKLLGALEAFEPLGLSVQDRVVVDAGASTGGFTDVLLRRGARLVHAVDVGYGQLAWSLQSDDRVVVRDRCNVRYLAAGDLKPVPSLAVGDLSFISLTALLQPLTDVCSPDADLVLMVKPQFEVGKDRLGSGGVVRDPALRAETVATVVGHAATLGHKLVAVTASPLPGPSGNVEYFVWLTRKNNAVQVPDVMDAIHTAVERGPAGKPIA